MLLLHYGIPESVLERLVDSTNYQACELRNEPLGTGSWFCALICLKCYIVYVLTKLQTILREQNYRNTIIPIVSCPGM